MDPSASAIMVKVLSSDGKTLLIHIEDACACDTLKNLIEDSGHEDVIPLPNVSASVCAAIFEFIKAIRDAKDADDEKENIKTEIKRIENDFVDCSDTQRLFDLILAANYLHHQRALDLLSSKIASMIRGKTTEELRATFNIQNDFTPEEEEKIRQENAWAFDG